MEKRLQDSPEDINCNLSYNKKIVMQRSSYQICIEKHVNPRIDNWIES